MAYVEHPDAVMQANLRRVSESILRHLKGEDTTVAAMACFHVALAIWDMGGATREQVKTVVDKALEVAISERSN